MLSFSLGNTLLLSMKFVRSLLRPFIGIKNWFMRRSRVGKVVVTVLAVLAFFIVRGILAGPTPVAPTFASASREDIKEIVSASGVLQGGQNAELRFLGAGKLAYLGVKSGDTVTKGQVIARLDTIDLGIALQQAQNTLRDREAAVQKVLDDVKGHSADESFAQKTLRTSAEVARDNAYDAVRAAQAAFRNSVITAPFAGVVTNEITVVPGQNVTAADRIALVSDFTEVAFEADIDESEIGKVALGQEVEISLDSYEDEVFSGRIAQIMPSVVTGTTGATTVKVKIILDGTAVNKIYGLNGTADIVTAKKSGVLTIPLEALYTEDEVIVERNGKLEVVKVKTGISSDTSIEILDGLASGERVVTNPTDIADTLNK